MSPPRRWPEPGRRPRPPSPVRSEAWRRPPSARVPVSVATAVPEEAHPERAEVQAPQRADGLWGHRGEAVTPAALRPGPAPRAARRTAPHPGVLDGTRGRSGPLGGAPGRTGARTAARRHPEGGAGPGAAGAPRPGTATRSRRSTGGPLGARTAAGAAVMTTTMTMRLTATRARGEHGRPPDRACGR